LEKALVALVAQTAIQTVFREEVEAVLVDKLG
jgi:hypothetical protein